MGTYNTISAGPVFLALRVDALLRLGRAEEAAAAVSGFEAFNPGHDRVMAAPLAAFQVLTVVSRPQVARI